MERTNDISGTVLVNFCTQVGYVKSKHKDDKSPLEGACSRSRDPFLPQSQQQLFTEVVKEVERKINKSFTSSKQSHTELVGHVTDKSYEIQLGLRRVQDEVRTCNERQLLGSNMTIMLAEIQGTCASVASGVNTTEELLTEELQQHRRLLGAVNQTCATTAAEGVVEPLQGLRDCSALQNSLSVSAMAQQRPQQY